MGFLAKAFGSMSGFNALDKATQNALDEIAARASQGLTEFTITVREFDVPRLPLDYTVTAITEAIQNSGHSVLSTQREAWSGVARLLVRPATPATMKARVGAVIASVQMQTEPSKLAADPVTNSLFVVSFKDLTITVVDTATWHVKKTFVTEGYNPTGVDVDPTAGNAYVVVGRDVWVIDTSTLEVTTIIEADASEFISVNSYTHTAYVVNWFSKSLTTISTLSNRVIGKISLEWSGAPLGLTVDPVTDQTYVLMSDMLAGNSEIWVIEGSRNQVKNSIPLPRRSMYLGLGIEPESHSLYAYSPDDLVIIDVLSGRASSISVPAGARMSIVPSTGFGYITTSGQHVLVVDTRSWRIVDSIPVNGNSLELCIDDYSRTVFVATDRGIDVIR